MGWGTLVGRKKEGKEVGITLLSNEKKKKNRKIGQKWVGAG